MAGRIRSIKPEILDDEEAAGLSDPAWRLWVSTWVLADDAGNCRAGDRYLAAQVWQDTARSVGIVDLLQELHAKKRVEVYEIAGDRYLHLRNWEVHQRIDNAGKPRVPGPDDDRSRPWPPFRGEPPRVAAGLGGEGETSPPDLRPPTSDLRPTTTTRVCAREGENQIQDKAIALARAWPSAGLHGLPGSPQMLEAAEALGDLDPLEACRSWLQLLHAWRSKGVLIKQIPAKFAEHLRGGLVHQVAAGDIDLGAVADPSSKTKPKGREPPRYDSEDEVRRRREAASRGES